MKKRKDWVNRFIEAIDKAQTQEIDWKTFNCGYFLTDVIFAMTGENIGERFKVKAATEKSAMVTLRQFSKGGVIETAEKIAAEYDIPEVSPAYAKRGDPVVADIDGVIAFGVVDLSGRFVLVVTPKRGVSPHPHKHIIRAWSIP